MRLMTCPHGPSLNENETDNLSLLAKSKSVRYNRLVYYFPVCQYHMQCDNRKHIFNMLTYGGPVTPWRACYNMIISWQGTD